MERDILRQTVLTHLEIHLIPGNSVLFLLSEILVGGGLHI